jgi:ParB family chromosome partitioning protein
MSLRDKASKIDFASIVPAAPANPESAKPKTAPGAMMAMANEQRSELLRENDELRAKAERVTELEGRLDDAVEELRGWDGAKPTRRIDPREIRRSAYANRHESSFQNQSFKDLKRDIQDAGGNVQPVKVRALANEIDGAKFELVYGHRRHEACLELGLPVLAFVDNLTDQALFEEMERENRERADLSAWEQGTMYAKALDTGLYASARQLAAAIGVDPTNLTKALALARMPSEVVEAFLSPLDLQFRWATDLKAALEADPAALKARARKLGQERTNMSAKAIFASLVSPEGGTSIDVPAVRSFEKNGKVQGTMKLDKAGRATIKISAPMSTARQQKLAKLLQGFFDSE